MKKTIKKMWSVFLTVVFTWMFLLCQNVFALSQFFEGGGVPLVEGEAIGGIPLTLLSHDPNAVCLDGSPAGIYYRRSSDPANYEDKWVMYLNGGAWCWSLENCYQRSSTILGSSKKWPKFLNRGLAGPLSDNCTLNPTFCKFNFVLVGYCDGNSFSGMRKEHLVFNNTKLFFKGKYVLNAAVQYMLQNLTTRKNVSEFVLTGGSAGGLATFLHSDDVRDILLKEPPVAARLKKFGALPISGFFLQHSNIAYLPVYQDHMEGAFYLHNATFGVSSQCIESVLQSATPSELWRCNFAQAAFAASTVPTFILNSKNDMWQLPCILNVMPLTNPQDDDYSDVVSGNCSAVPNYECLQFMDYHTCSSKQMRPVLSFQSSFLQQIFTLFTAKKGEHIGAFVDSCYTHCEAQIGHNFNKIVVQDTTMEKAVGKWWATMPMVREKTSFPVHSVFNLAKDALLQASKEESFEHLYIDCPWTDKGNYSCNPTCSGP